MENLSKFRLLHRNPVCDKKVTNSTKKEGKGKNVKRKNVQKMYTVK